MRRFVLMTASVVALGMAAPATAQALGPNDAFIDQIGDRNGATVSQTGSSGSGKGSDIDQISGNAAEVTQAGKGKLNKSTMRAYVIQLGAGRTNDQNGVGRNDPSLAVVGDRQVSLKGAPAKPTAPSSSGRAQGGGREQAGAGASVP
jgi:hypothetical protein